MDALKTTVMVTVPLAIAREDVWSQPYQLRLLKGDDGNYALQTTALLPGRRFGAPGVIGPVWVWNTDEEIYEQAMDEEGEPLIGFQASDDERIANLQVYLSKLDEG